MSDKAAISEGLQTYEYEEEDMYWGEGQLELIEKIGKENWYISLM